MAFTKIPSLNKSAALFIYQIIVFQNSSFNCLCSKFQTMFIVYVSSPIKYIDIKVILKIWLSFSLISFSVQIENV